MADSNLWYEAGLRFECQRCGGCCRGEPGYVWVNDAEIAAMAKCMGLTADEFSAMYVRRVGNRRSLKELVGGDCVLWGGSDQGCLVYAARPVQCRTFPFWGHNVSSPEAWMETGRRCPGLNRGKKFSVAEIRSRTKATR